MTTAFLGNMKLSESGNVIQDYTVTIVGGASPVAEASLVFDAPFSAVPKILSVYVIDTDGAIRTLISDVFVDTISTTGLDVHLHGLYDAGGAVNIGTHTFVVGVTVRGQV
jgi:hypothetical protein